MNAKCIFSAPHSFLDEIKNDFNSLFDTEFREIWKVSDLIPSNSLNCWVVNPGQKFIINKEVLKLFPNLDLIITPSTGKNHINETDCKNKKIKVLGLLDIRSVLETITASSEFTFLLILNSLRRLDYAVSEVSNNRWRDNEDLLRGYELNGRKVGIVGLGRIGFNIARWCDVFGAKVFYSDPYKENNKFKKIDIDELFSSSDIICITTVLTDETFGLINYQLLSKLKKNASLINSSRGEIIVEEDLLKIIEERDDIKVCLDVLSGEVKNAQFESPLIKLNNNGRITITPHIAGATFDSQKKAALGSVKLIKNHYNII